MNIKKKKYKGKIILIILLIIIFFSLFYYFINDKEKDNIITNTIKDITNYISKLTSFNYKSNNDLIKEINNDYKKEIDNLKEVLELNRTNSDKKLINATVTKRSNDYYELITIDKGKKDGIKKGYAVININGVLGRVINVNNISSDIKLITSIKDNYISVKFNYENKDYYGIINKYDNKKNEFTLINVIGDFSKDKIKDINVVTSGLSDNIKSGLLIGKIIDITKDEFGLSNIIKIKPLVDFNNINIVTVVGDNND